MAFRDSIHDQALEMAAEIRDQINLEFWSPIPIYDVCEQLGLTVRLDHHVSMEGVYIGSGLKRPTIIISTLRPLLRRNFTCAHELGHHVFGDGLIIDEIEDDRRGPPDLTERRADSFAGHFLMPHLAVSRAFSRRGLEPESSSPDQVFVVACALGVGYSTIVTHLKYALRLISQAQYVILNKASLPSIRTSILGRTVQETLMVADESHESSTVDIEVGTLVILPRGVMTKVGGLTHIESIATGELFLAENPGLFQATNSASGWSAIVRVAIYKYHGLAKFRHIGEDADE